MPPEGMPPAGIIPPPGMLPIMAKAFSEEAAVGI